MAIEITEQQGLRLMRFGTPWCQGAMRIAAPDELVMAYAVRMFGWLPFHDPDGLADRHLVTLGLGAGSLTRFAHRVLGMHTTAVEIDAQVIEACRAHFELPPDGPRLRVVHGDAADFVRGLRGTGSVDVLQVDTYDAAVDQPALDSAAFYADCRSALREGGTLAVNLIGGKLDLRASVARLRSGVRPRAVWQFPPTTAGNVVVIAPCGEVPPDEALSARAAAIESRWGLPAPAWLAMARRTPGAVRDGN